MAGGASAGGQESRTGGYEGLDQAQLREVLAERDATLAERDAALVQRDATLAELRTEVADLRRLLEALLAEQGKNSSNSHLPPSSDGPGASTRSGGPKRRKKPKSSRARGGQKGHKGSHRALVPVDQVDEIVRLYPEACGACAAALAEEPEAEEPEAEPRRHQQVDLVGHKVIITEWQRHELVCACGARTLAPYDPSVIPKSRFGPGVIGAVVFLTGVLHLGRRMAQVALEELLGIRMSLGALSKLEGRASEALKPVYEAVVAEVEQAKVKYTDATNWLIAGVLLSLWTLATATATVFRIFPDGRRETIRDFYGGRSGILVSDRASVFKGLWAETLRQICWAHLLRKFVAFSERDGPKGRFGKTLLGYTSLVFKYWNDLRSSKLPREEFDRLMAKVRRQFEATLEAAVRAQIPQLSGSCADILAHRAALWTYMEHEGVEPTNNHAERELRRFVIWRKISFGSQSERGQRYAERVMTVAHTARKRAVPVLDFLTRCMAAHNDGAPAPKLAAKAA